MQNDQNKPLDAQKESQTESNGMPKFGKLLIVLAFAVAIMVALTYGSMLYYTN